MSTRPQTSTPRANRQHRLRLQSLFEVAALLIYVVFERAAFFGFYTSSIQYLLNMYELSTETVNALTSGFNFMTYFLSVVGAVLSDVRFGRWKACLSAGIVYLAGFCSGPVFLLQVCVD